MKESIMKQFYLICPIKSWNFPSQIPVHNEKKSELQSPKSVVRRFPWNPQNGDTVGIASRELPCV